jgi:hypothetical protein
VFLKGDFMTFTAKQIIHDYNVVILTETRREAQYIRDKFILRCSHANIWHTYKSPTINMSENHIFTVFEIPNLVRYEKKSTILGQQSKGYIYGTAFQVHCWSVLTDNPHPQGFIEQIRMNIRVEKDENNYNRIIVG